MEHIKATASASARSRATVFRPRSRGPVINVQHGRCFVSYQIQVLGHELVQAPQPQMHLEPRLQIPPCSLRQCTQVRQSPRPPKKHVHYNVARRRWHLCHVVQFTQHCVGALLYNPAAPLPMFLPSRPGGCRTTVKGPAADPRAQVATKCHARISANHKASNSLAPYTCTVASQSCTARAAQNQTMFPNIDNTKWKHQLG